MSVIQTEIDKRILRAIGNLLDNSDFRLVMGHVLCLTGIENTVMAESTNQMCFLEGRRSVGLEIARYFDAIRLHSNELAGYEARQKILADYKRHELSILHDLKEGGVNHEYTNR